MEKTKFTENEKISLLKDLDYEIKQESVNDDIINMVFVSDEQTNIVNYNGLVTKKYAIKNGQDISSENELNKVFKREFVNNLHPLRIEKLGIVFDKIKNIIIENIDF